MILSYSEFLNESKKEKYAIGTKVWFIAKDKNGAQLYKGAHTIIDNTKRLYKVKGKDYEVEASASEISDTKPDKSMFN